MATVPEEASSVETYTVDDIASLMVGAFYYARGNQQLHRYLFSFFATEYGDRFTDKNIVMATPYVVESALEQVNNKKAHPHLAGITVKYVEDEVHVQATELSIQLSTDEEPTSIPTILLELVLTEARHIPYKKFPDQQDAPPPNVTTRPSFRSNLIHHGLLGRPAGRPEFIRLFQVLGETFWSIGDADIPVQGRNQINDVFVPIVAAHLAYHDEDSLALANVVRSRNAN